MCGRLALPDECLDGEKVIIHIDIRQGTNSVRFRHTIKYHCRYLGSMQYMVELSPIQIHYPTYGYYHPSQGADIANQFENFCLLGNYILPNVHRYMYIDYTASLHFTA